jgi:hypothetical protein
MARSSEPDRVYTDHDGFTVRVHGLTHVTELSPTKWAYTYGPRHVSKWFGSAPAVHDGAFYDSGRYKYVEHDTAGSHPQVVQDLACEEGRAVWGKNYVRTKDGAEGPTVDSIRSPRKLKAYMLATGHRLKDRGEEDPLKARRAAAARKINPRIQAEISRLMGD